MKIRIVGVLLLLAMLISVLAACGTSDTPKPAGQETNQNGQTPSGGKETSSQGGNETSSQGGEGETSSQGGEGETSSQGGDPGTETGPVVVIDDPTDDGLEAEDFNKYVFTVLYSRRGLLVLSETEDFTGDLIEDAIYEGAEAVKEKYNVVYERILAGGDDEMSNRVQNSVLSAGTVDEFSMTIGHDFLTVQNAMRGCYADLTEVEAFDNFSKPWWPLNNLNSISVGGRLYAASSYVSYSPLAASSAILFNKKLIRDLGLDAPYSLVTDGNWTMEQLLEYAQAGYQDLNNDGVINIDSGEVYGFSMGRECGYTFQRSVDVVPIQKDQNDLPYFDLDVERAHSFLSNLDSIFEFGKFFLEDNNSHNVAFGANASLMIFTSLNTVYKTIRAYEGITYGFLPVPKLDQEQENYIAGSTDLLWGIPQTSSGHMKEISSVIQSLSCQCYNYVLPAFYESTMKTKLSDTPEDVDMLDIIRDSTALSFAYFYSRSLGGAAVSMADLPRQTKAGEIASYVSANQKTLEENIAHLIEQYQELQNLLD